MRTLIDTIKLNQGMGFTIEIHQDVDAESPREWDNLGTMYCEHGRYDLGDKDAEHPDNVKDILIALPLYLYDHSGISMRTNAFSCAWDSGLVGMIYVTEEKVKKEWQVDVITEELKAQVTQCLMSEVKTYDQYLTGEVYGFIVKDKNDEFVDSCWGFFGSDHDASGLLDHAKSNVPSEVQLELF